MISLPRFEQPYRARLDLQRAAFGYGWIAIGLP